MTWRLPPYSRLLLSAFAVVVPITTPSLAVASSASPDFGDISHKGLKDLGPASAGLKLSLELGLVANQQGIANAVKSASNPSSSSYGKYLSLSTLQQKYGATSSRRNAVINAFKTAGVTATVDVTHLRVTATISIGNAQKLFGTKWDLYATGGTNQAVALPVDTPMLEPGLAGNVDTVAGLGLDVTTHVSASISASHARAAQETAVDGGTPTRTGTIDPGCAGTAYPGAVSSSAGLFPNEILDAYGIAPLQASGLKGQGVRVAILGEAPTPANDVTAYRSCFGFPGTTLKIHGGSGITPILESSLDAMTLSMVAPELARLDLWVKQLGHDDPQGVLELLAEPLQATTNGTPLPNVISISYGACEASVKPYTAALTLVDRQLAATSALGITTVVAAGDSGSSSCAHGVPSSQLDSFDKQKSASWPATSPWVLAAGGTNITLTPANAIESSGVWNDTTYARPYTADGRGRGRRQHLRESSLVAACDLGAEDVQDGSGHRRVRRREPRLRDHLLERRAGLRPRGGPDDLVRRRHERGCSPRRGDDRPVGPAGRAVGTAEARVRPAAPLLHRAHDPTSFLDIVTGNNSVFSNVSCCSAGTGFDMASGLGSPFADLVAKHLHH